MYALYAFYDLETGQIMQRSTVMCTDTDGNPGVGLDDGPEAVYKEAQKQARSLGLGALLASDKSTPGTAYVDIANQKFVQIPPAPEGGKHVFNYGLRQWVDPRSLDKFKQDQWDIVKADRDAAEYGGFDVPGVGRFDSDATSQSKIMGEAFAASLSPATYSADWTLQNNDVATLDAQGILAVGMALSAHVKAVHEQGRVLRAAIEAATTYEAARAVVWPAVM